MGAHCVAARARPSLTSSSYALSPRFPTAISLPLSCPCSITDCSQAHALGFSSSKFSSFRKPGTNVRESYSNIIRNFNELGKTGIKKIVTQNVIAKAKEHYGCDSWPNAGGALEDFGGSGESRAARSIRLVCSGFLPRSHAAIRKFGDYPSMPPVGCESRVCAHLLP